MKRITSTSTLTVLIIISLSCNHVHSTFSEVIPEFEIIDEINVDWVYSPTYNGQYSIKLSYPYPESNAKAIIKVPYGDTFNSLHSFSFYVKYLKAVPRFSIYLDKDQDGNVDSVLISDYLEESNGKWIRGTGGLRWGWSERTYPEFSYGDPWEDLEFWKNQYPSAIVTHIGIIRFPGGSHQETMENVYVDGVIINDAFFDFELPNKNWLTYKNDPSSRSTFEYPNIPPYELVWKTPLGSNPSSIVHENDSLYLGRMSTIEAYSKNSNERLWSTFLGARASTPAIGQDAIFVSTWDTRIFSLDKDNGEIIWEYESQYQLLDDAHGGFFIYPSPKMFEEMLFVGLSDGRMHALDIQNGTSLWTYYTGSERHSSVAITEDMIIFGSNGPRSSGRYLYALDIFTGNEIWTKSLGGNIVSTPAIFEDTCYVGCQNKIFALDVDNGGIIWSTEINQRNIIESSPAVTEDYVLITGGEWDFTPPIGKLYCLSRQDGEILWNVGEYFSRSSPSVTGDVVVIGEYKPFLKDAKIFAYNITTGDILWEYDAEAEIIYCNPSFGIESLYLASHDNFLYYFKPAELIIDEIYSSGIRVDVDSIQDVEFHVSWSHDNSDAGNVRIKINDIWYSTNETGWISVEVSSFESQEISYNISDIQTRTQYKMLVNVPSIIWDRVSIEIPESQRIDLNSRDYSSKGCYEYDEKAFVGTLLLNDTMQKNEVGRYGYRVMGIIDDLYGLTNFFSNDFELIYDRINIELECETPRLDIGIYPIIIVKSEYDYDRLPFQGSVSLNTLEESIGEHDLYIESINDPLYGLSVFSHNKVSCIWDQVVVELSLDNNRINIGEEPEILVLAYYDYDHKSFVGEIDLIQPSTYMEIGEFSYSIANIEDYKYNLTKFVSENVTCIWDRIKISEGGVSKDSSIIRNTEVVWYRAEYEYDSETVDGSKGILYLNDEPMVWSSTNTRWELEVTSENPEIKTYQVTDVFDNKYGLNSINDEVGLVSIEWKQRGIPGFPFESILMGLIISIIIIWIIRRKS